MNVDYSKERKNINNPVKVVRHKDLERFSDESYWKRICPECGGLLLVGRDNINFHIQPEDNCVLCGQGYIYEDILPLSNHDREKLALEISTICKFGKGIQDMKTCKMIYIHWPGYYPTNESYQFVLENHCPNFQKEDQNVSM